MLAGSRLLQAAVLAVALSFLVLTASWAVHRQQMCGDALARRQAGEAAGARQYTAQFAALGVPESVAEDVRRYCG